MKLLLSVIVFSLSFLCSSSLFAQYWQQSVSYDMDISMDTENNQMKGKQRLVYQNNSPDALDMVFYHLYFNAFQPGSMMDERSITINDPDKRVGNRITALQPDEIGFHQVLSLTQDGAPCSYTIEGTILEVTLNKIIPPGGESVFEMKFLSQVPVQIRRSGRDNKEGIRYSMSQWYPKMCEYDRQGWHANPYVGREFHGIWGDFNVSITIDNDYIVGGTGYLINENEIEVVQTKKKKKKKKKKRKNIGTNTWHFEAQNVHDFVWAADPDYTHTEMTTVSGIETHYYYQEGERTTENWENLPKIMDAAFSYINERYGKYPFKKYSFIQGGDGGMEYPMATLITGERNIGSLVGVSVHELMHSWYHMVLGTNESLYPWMDEGFTSFASADVMNYLRKEGLIPGEAVPDPHLGSYTSYIGFSQSGMEEALTTHADHYSSNAAYGVGSYVKGAVFLGQLRYIMGDNTFYNGMLKYYDTWKFKHPDPIDFIRIMEKTSGLELDWYREYMVNTTHTSDYGIEDIREGEKGTTQIDLKRYGKMPMPVNIRVITRDGAQKWFHIPLRIMRGERTEWPKGIPVETLKDWPWTHLNYNFNLPISLKDLKTVEIDPLLQTADINRENNRYDHGE